MAFPISAAIGGLGALGGLFGGEEDPDMPPEMRALYKRAKQLYRLRLQFAKGIPGSAPGELAASAQLKGQLGEQMGNAYSEFQATRGARGPVSGSDADATRIFGESQAGNLMNADMGMMAQFLQNRQNAFQELPGILGAAGGLASSGFAAGRPAGGGTDPLGALGAAAYQYGFGQSSKPSGAIKPPVSSVSMAPPDFSEAPDWYKPKERARGGPYSYIEPGSYF